jgi:hypothetical protein
MSSQVERRMHIDASASSRVPVDGHELSERRRGIERALRALARLTCMRRGHHRYAHLWTGEV